MTEFASFVTLSHLQSKTIQRSRLPVNAWIRFTACFNACDTIRMDNNSLPSRHVLWRFSLDWTGPGQHPENFFVALKSLVIIERTHTGEPRQSSISLSHIVDAIPANKLLASTGVSGGGSISSSTNPTDG